MSLWQHIVQIVLDIAGAFRRFGRDIYVALIGTGRHVRSYQRCGAKRIATLKAAGAFKHVNPRSAVVVHPYTGDFVIGRTADEALKQYAESFGDEVPIYLYQITPRWV